MLRSPLEAGHRRPAGDPTVKYDYEDVTEVRHDNHNGIKTINGKR